MLRDPSSTMATFALEQIDIAISLFTSLTQHGANTPRYFRNLQWLHKLHARASAKISKASAAQKSAPQRGAELDQQVNSEDREDAEEVELLGWRTRLIERVGQGRPTISTIGLSPTPASHATNTSNPLPNQDIFDDQNQPWNKSAVLPGASLTFTTPDPTDVLVRATTLTPIEQC